MNFDSYKIFSDLDDIIVHKSLNTTKQMVLRYHFWYNDNNRVQRNVVKINGSGWSTHDFFKDYFVINEAKYKDATKYTEIAINQLTVEHLDDACFAFSGSNQVKIYILSSAANCDNIIIFCRSLPSSKKIKI
jgi:hypothetical protein